MKFLLLLLVINLLSGPSWAMTKPIIIAHRGASADRPEHTIAAYRLAIEQGADFIEPDLVITKDGHLVARHENEISETTNVAEKPEFANRRTTKTIDGRTITGWFTEDFTLAELKTLRARERLPQLRPANTAFNDQEAIPTFAEIIALAKAQQRPIGLYPETKHPSYFRGLGLPLEEPLLKLLTTNGYTSATDPVFIQSFEAGNLKALRPQTKLRLIQLVYSAETLDDNGLKTIATYADGIGAEKSLVIPRTPDGNLGEATDLVTRAQKAGLLVHLWTFRPENYFLPASLKSSDKPMDRGNAEAEIRLFLNAGIDGLFADSVPAAVQSRR